MSKPKRTGAGAQEEEPTGSGGADADPRPEAPAGTPEATVPRKRERGSPDGAKSLAPRTKESFDDLAKRVARTEPRRGSIVQPPPAWEPDEVTLGFAMVADPSGASHELPASTLLATVLIAVELDRRAILNRMATGFEEEVDAVASLYWPFLVHHGGPDERVAIFDGTGVWKRTFRYTSMPPTEGVASFLAPAPTAKERLAQMRSVTEYLTRDAGAEVFTVEGFLPVDPPLLYDVLTQSRFRSDPQAPHAGFLPARHPMEWYDGEVQRMRQWLDRFEVDLRFLAETRTRMDAVLKETQAQLDEEQRAEEEAGRRRADEATARSAAAIAQIHQSHHAEVDGHLEAMRKAQAAMARGEAAARAADTLAFRSAQRRTDPGPHQARSREAQQAVRGAARQVGESRRAIEKVHERQRASLEGVLAQTGEVERANAQLLAERELFRDEFVAAATEALQSIDGQIAARSTQRNVLAGYFLPFPALAPVRVVWLPLWMATLRSPKGVRQVAFPPMQVRGGVGLGGTLKRLLGGIVLPLEPRTAQFDKVLRPTMEEAVARDPWLSAATQELTRAADVLVDPDLLVRLQEGLSDLRTQGWVSKKQEEEYFRVYSDRARRRAESGQPAPSAVPPGPRVDGASAPASSPRAPPPGPS